MTTEAPRDEYRLPKGAVIFRQGDPGNEMYVIAAGRVRLTIGTGGHEKEINVLGPGEFFGELSLLSNAPRSATATAVDDTVLLCIGRDVFSMLVQDDLDIVFRMFDIQGRRLSQTNVPLQELSQRLTRVRVAARALRQVLAGGDSRVPARLSVAALVAEVEAVDLRQHGVEHGVHFARRKGLPPGPSRLNRPRMYQTRVPVSLFGQNPDRAGGRSVDLDLVPR